MILFLTTNQFQCQKEMVICKPGLTCKPVSTSARLNQIHVKLPARLGSTSLGIPFWPKEWPLIYRCIEVIAVMIKSNIYMWWLSSSIYRKLYICSFQFKKKVLLDASAVWPHMLRQGAANAFDPCVTQAAPIQNQFAHFGGFGLSNDIFFTVGEKQLLAMPRNLNSGNQGF